MAPWTGDTSAGEAPPGTHPLAFLDALLLPSPCCTGATASDCQDRLAWKALRVIWQPEKGQDGPVGRYFRNNALTRAIAWCARRTFNNLRAAGYVPATHVTGRADPL